MDPYRSPASLTAPCAQCGASLSVDARSCSLCGEEASRVRCLNCFSLVATTAASCAHCGGSLELEPELVASTLSCPRCTRGLYALESGDVRVFECKSCGGMFVDHDVLTHVIVGHKPAVNHVATVAVPPLPAPEMQVSYLPCPVCTNRMNRAIFGRKSGVVIDVCKMHGSWFDVRELTGCIAFIEQGGLERAEKQALEEKRDAIRRARIERRTDAMTEALHAPASRFDMGPESVHPDVLIDLLQVLLGS